MKIRINFDVCGEDISDDDCVDIIDSAGLNIFKNYQHKVDLRQDVEIWHIDVDDFATINIVRNELQRHLPPNAFIQERIVPELTSVELDHEFFLDSGFGDEASRAETTHHTDSVLTCPACGNRYQDPDFVPGIKPALLPAKPILMEFYGRLKLFCRPKFIDKYEQAGLTGLSFVDWGITDKHKVPLSLVRVAQHRWQDRTGVCDTCEMKTNFTNSYGLLNTHERFLYDFQYVRTFDQTTGDIGTVFVLSRKAVDFIMSQSKTIKDLWMGGQGLYPILPGYMEDYVWPEPKLFAHGEIPLYMLRSSWDKAGK